MESISKFIKILIEKTQGLSGTNGSEFFWFRGEGRIFKNPLIPSSYRNNILDDVGSLYFNELRKIENNINSSFIRKAMPYINSSGIENTSWNRYFMMQHRNISTRLLDWSENALIALFFAISDKQYDNSDAVVWILQPFELNNFVIYHLFSDVEMRRFIPNLYDNEERIPLLDKKGDLNLSELTTRYFRMDFEKTGCETGIHNPLAIYPPYLDQRMSSQKSCFTIFGNKQNGLFPNEKESIGFLDKIIIPFKSKTNILKELKILGVDFTSIYPDLDGLGKAINMEYEGMFKNNTG